MQNFITKTFQNFIRGKDIRKYKKSAFYYIFFRLVRKYLNSNITGSVYIFELNKKYDIDGSVSYNKAKYINHSCNPNCEVDIVDNRIWISSIKNIKKNDELSYDYGYEFDKDDFRDHICKCGEKNCIGYIISSDDWKNYFNFIKKIIKKRINSL